MQQRWYQSNVVRPGEFWDQTGVDSDYCFVIILRVPLGHCEPTVPQKGVIFVKFQLFSKCFFFNLYDYFRLLYTCFQHQNIFISIFVLDWDIFIFWRPKYCQEYTFFKTPSNIFPIWLITTDLIFFAQNWFHIKRKQCKSGPRFHSRWVKMQFSGSKMHKIWPNSANLVITRYYTAFSYFCLLL